MSRLEPQALVVTDLRVEIGAPLVRDVSFTIEPGSAFGLVGESGSGKSLTSKAILNLLPRHARTTGSVRLGEQELLTLGPKAMRAIRGARISMVFQDPMSALNPLLRVGNSIAQVIVSHDRVDKRQALGRAIELMERVGIQDAARRARSYPHEFSGGMRQRIVIAMALASKPSVLLADEPTTALDVLVQTEILQLIDELRRQDGMSVLLVSHDFAVIAGSCEQVGVMYAGELVEQGPAEQVLTAPRHPYTAGLLASHPDGQPRGTLRPIQGAPPEAGQLPVGCAFAARCAHVQPDCRVAPISEIPMSPARTARCLHPLHDESPSLGRSR